MHVDLDVLRELAGDKVFARGEAYCRDGRVQLLGVEENRVLARVGGTDDYQVALTASGRTISGTCSCPAFDETGFCKHLVAVALAANEPGGVAGGALARIRTYLESKRGETLVDVILEWAAADAQLFRRLDLAAASAGADGLRMETELRRVIDEATRTHGFVDYGAAGGWATGVGAALDMLADVAASRHAGIVLRLAERAIDRIEKALENIDDSDGHGSVLLERAGAIHLAAARTALPDPVPFGRRLFGREMTDEYGAFYDIAERYAEVLGEPGLAEYRRLAQAAWDELPTRGGDRSGGTLEFDHRYHLLAGILDFFARQAGDVEARVALRSKDLSTPYQYLLLAKFCLEQARSDEALRWAEEGLRTFESRPDERLVVLAAELLAASGRRAEAVGHLWNTFEKQPTRPLYDRLSEMEGAAAQDRAIGFLEGRLAGARQTPPYGTAHLLVSILVAEARFDAAWTAVRKYGVSSALQESLARASEATHPGEAIAAYDERVLELVGLGGNLAYEGAAELIARMARLRSAAEQADYVAGLKTRFARKRNFMRLLG